MKAIISITFLTLLACGCGKKEDNSKPLTYFNPIIASNVDTTYTDEDFIDGKLTVKVPGESNQVLFEAKFENNGIILNSGPAQLIAVVKRSYGGNFQDSNSSDNNSHYVNAYNPLKVVSLSFNKGVIDSRSEYIVKHKCEIMGDHKCRVGTRSITVKMVEHKLVKESETKSDLLSPLSMSKLNQLGFSFQEREEVIQSNSRYERRITKRYIDVILCRSRLSGEALKKNLGTLSHVIQAEINKLEKNFRVMVTEQEKVYSALELILALEKTITSDEIQDLIENKTLCEPRTKSIELTDESLSAISNGLRF